MLTCEETPFRIGEKIDVEDLRALVLIRYVAGGYPNESSVQILDRLEELSRTPENKFLFQKTKPICLIRGH
jgi:hypothetical protein